MLKISLLILMGAAASTTALDAGCDVARAAPDSAKAAAAPTAATAKAKVAARAKAVAFLDEVAASYRKLHSLSATWQRTGYDPATGSFAWRQFAWRRFARRSRPPQLRFEDQKDHLVLISDGLRKHLTVDRETTGNAIDRTWQPPSIGARIDVLDIGCDEMTGYFLNGQNPLRAPRWNRYLGDSANSEARLLGTATVAGTRCRGVEISEVIEGRDDSTTSVFRLWFDARNLLRRSQERTIGGSGQTVDFELHPNPKLPDALFLVPALRNGSN